MRPTGRFEPSGGLRRAAERQIIGTGSRSSGILAERTPMRRASNLLHRLARVSIMMISVGSGDAIRVAAADEAPPAQLCSVTGDTAKDSLPYGSRSPSRWVPPQGGGRDHRRVRRGPATNQLLCLKSLSVPADPGPGCVHEGAVACCDPGTGMFKLSSEGNGQPVWVDMGEKRQLVPIDPNPYDDYVGPGAEEVPLSSNTFAGAARRMRHRYRVFHQPGVAPGRAAGPLVQTGLAERRALAAAASLCSAPGSGGARQLSSRAIIPFRPSCPTTDTPSPACCKKMRTAATGVAAAPTSTGGSTKPSGNWCRREGCDCIITAPPG